MKKLTYILTLSLLVAPTIFYADDIIVSPDIETEVEAEGISQSDVYMADADHDSAYDQDGTEYEVEEYEEIEEPSV